MSEVIVSGGGGLIRSCESLIPYARFNPESEALEAFLANTNGGADIGFGDFTAVKTPSGGGQFWEISIPGMAPESVAALEGVIVFQAQGGILWPSLENNSGDKPVAVTRDMRVAKITATVTRDQDGNITQIANVFDQEMVREISRLEFRDRRGFFPWNDLSYSKFGSGRGGNGKFVKEGTTLFLQRKTGILPLMVRTSPSAIKPIRAFLFNLQVPYWRAVVKITLKKESSSVPDPSRPGSQKSLDYSVPVLTLVETLPPEAGDLVKSTVHSKLSEMWNAGAIDVQVGD